MQGIVSKFELEPEKKVELIINQEKPPDLIIQEKPLEPPFNPEEWIAEFLANLPINPAAQIDTPLIWEKYRLISFPDFHLSTLVSSDAEPPISSISPEIQALIAKYFVDLTSAQPTGNDGGSKLDDET